MRKSLFPQYNEKRKVRVIQQRLRQCADKRTTTPRMTQENQDNDNLLKNNTLKAIDKLAKHLLLPDPESV